MSDDSERDDDPFEAFDAPDDVDPFEDLQGPDEESTDDAATTSDDNQTPPGRMADDPFSQTAESGDDADVPFGGEVKSGADVDGDTDDTDPTDDPFASFAGAGSRGSPDDDPFSTFESVGVDEVDPDVVWDALSTAEEEGVPEFDEKVFYEVSKHSFCERCEFFSGPPETRCTYEGAAIVEFLDMETVRLVNCPVVAEQRQLEENVGKLGSE